MRNIVDIGKQGAEHVDIDTPGPHQLVTGIEPYLPVIEKFPVTKIEAEINDGTKKSIEVHSLLLNNPQVFGLAWHLAMYEPIVYAQQADRTVMGILSPNFDEHGQQRRPSLKIIPLKQAYPLIQQGTDLLPDAQMATMLAGSAHAEGAGVGSHAVAAERDYEHKLAIVGSISLGRNSITADGKHMQHALRHRSSVATGLSDGSLGNIFTADGQRTGGFPGYGMPMIFHPDTAQSTDTIYLPKGFLNSERAFGAYYTDAATIAYGASLQIMYDRMGQGLVNSQMAQIGRTTS